MITCQQVLLVIIHAPEFTTEKENEVNKLLVTISPFLLSLLPGQLFAAEEVVLSGTIETVSNAAACGICSPTHSVIDTSGNLSLQIGNSFVDLSSITGDEKVHKFSGYYYETTGQCGIGECTLFAIEKVDEKLIAQPSYDPTTEKLSIDAVIVNGSSENRFAVTLSPPFNVDNVIQLSAENTVLQTGDCSVEGTQCEDGTICVAYFGVAGGSGPLFESCEIPCSLPGASCPTGQACVTIADGPGMVCRVD